MMDLSNPYWEGENNYKPPRPDEVRAACRDLGVVKLIGDSLTRLAVTCRHITPERPTVCDFDGLADTLEAAIHDYLNAPASFARAAIDNEDSEGAYPDPEPYGSSVEYRNPGLAGPLLPGRYGS